MTGWGSRDFDCIEIREGEQMVESKDREIWATRDRSDSCPFPRLIYFWTFPNSSFFSFILRIFRLPYSWRVLQTLPWNAKSAICQRVESSLLGMTYSLLGNKAQEKFFSPPSFSKSCGKSEQQTMATEDYLEESSSTLRCCYLFMNQLTVQCFTPEFVGPLACDRFTQPIEESVQEEAEWSLAGEG